MRRRAAAVFVLALLAFTVQARAQKPQRLNGKWIWPIKLSGETRELAVKLKVDGEKLTGQFVGPEGKEVPIEDGKYEEGDFSFKITREREGSKFVVTFKARLVEDEKTGEEIIKGKMQFERGGETQERDWEARREKSKDKPKIEQDKSKTER